MGVIEEGAYADLLLINGDPTRDIRLLMDADKNIDLIMKDGKIYKNTMDCRSIDPAADRGLDTHSFDAVKNAGVSWNLDTLGRLRSDDGRYDHKVV